MTGFDDGPTRSGGGMPRRALLQVGLLSLAGIAGATAERGTTAASEDGRGLLERVPWLGKYAASGLTAEEAHQVEDVISKLGIENRADITEANQTAFREALTELRRIATGPEDAADALRAVISGIHDASGVISCGPLVDAYNAANLENTDSATIAANIFDRFEALAGLVGTAQQAAFDAYLASSGPETDAVRAQQLASDSYEAISGNAFASLTIAGVPLIKSRAAAPDPGQADPDPGMT